MGFNLIERLQYKGEYTVGLEHIELPANGHFASCMTMNSGERCEIPYDDGTIMLCHIQFRVRDNKMLLFLCVILKDCERGSIELGEIVNGGRTINLTLQKDKELIGSTIATWLDIENIPAQYKCRNYQMKTVNVLRFLADTTGVAFVEKEFKSALEYISILGNSIHLYELANLERLDYAEYNNVLEHIQGICERTNTGSCMMKPKAVFGWIGNDYFGNCTIEEKFYHPFHAYRTGDWRIAFISRLSPEEIANKDLWKSGTPFISRAFLSRQIKGWTYIAVYGVTSSIVHNLLDVHYCNVTYSILNAAVRLYELDNGEFLMPFIDGDDQRVEISYNRHADVDGAFYRLTRTNPEDRITETTMYKCDIDNGYAEEMEAVKKCYIRGHYFPVSELVYDNFLGEYIHEDFYRNGKLDLYEILSYYN